MRRGIACAVMAAVFYALNAPVSKVLLGRIEPSMLAALLYIGCGIGMAVVGVFERKGARHEEKLTRKELPYTLAMIVLDIAAPIALMMGLNRSSAESACNYDCRNGCGNKKRIGWNKMRICRLIFGRQVFFYGNGIDRSGK